MKLRKITALLLSFVLILSVLTSCDRTTEDVVKKADKALDKRAHTVEVDIDFRCSNTTVSGIFEQLERFDTNLYFKNGNFRADTDLVIDDGSSENHFYTEYVIIDGMLYCNIVYSSIGVRRDIKNKAEVDEEQKASIVGKLMLVGDFSLDSFSDIHMDKRDGEYIIECRGASEEKCIQLEKMLISQLEATSDSVKLTGAMMTVEIDDGKYDTVTYDCEYEVLLEGTVYTVGMTVTLEFDYDEYFKISVPADADKYETVKTDSIL